jgi:putative transposase
MLGWRRLARNVVPIIPPKERMAILELRAARGWSLQQTADTFLLTAPTIASWMKRLDEVGPQALVQLRKQVNKFPDFVRYAVQRLKTLCPSMGKVKVAQILCRAGLHLGATTVGRILKESPKPNPHKSAVSTGREVTAKRPNHVWHVDLTTVPIGGFWTSWLPFALPQSWPFCWWLAVVVDHFSRQIVGIAVFAKRPDCRTVCAMLGQAIRRTSKPPKYIVCDRDRIFDCRAFREWVKRKGIKPPRYGAIGKHGSIAVVERTIRTIKDECARRLLVPIRREQFRREIQSFVEWYNEHRPHTTLAGCTPDEVYFSRKLAQQKPRIEPRRQWPRPSPCAKPQTLVAGQPGDRFELNIERLKRRNHLPVVTLTRAA